MLENFLNPFLSLSIYFVCEHPYIDPYNCTWRKKGFLDPQFSDALAAEIFFFFNIFFSCTLSGYVEWVSYKKFFVPLSVIRTSMHSNFFLSLSFVYVSHVITYAYRIAYPSHVHHVRERIVKQHVLFFCSFFFLINLACDKIWYCILVVDVKGVNSSVDCYGNFGIFFGNSDRFSYVDCPWILPQKLMIVTENSELELANTEIQFG